MVARAPRKKMYRTMQGRMVDIEKLRAANETVQAVGNMNVNARGDQIGPGGKIISSKDKVIATYYEAPKGVVDDTPSRNVQTPAAKPAPVAKEPEVKVMTPMPPKAQPNPEPRKIVKPAAPKVTKPTTTTAKKGIDAALDGLE